MSTSDRTPPDGVIDPHDPAYQAAWATIDRARQQGLTPDEITLIVARGLKADRSDAAIVDALDQAADAKRHAAYNPVSTSE